jgi:hypothetical protein
MSCLIPLLSKQLRPLNPLKEGEIKMLQSLNTILALDTAFVLFGRERTAVIGVAVDNRATKLATALQKLFGFARRVAANAK